MQLEEAIKEVKTINKILDMNNYKTKTLLKYQINHYNYIVEDIKGVIYINIALQELKKNNYKYDEVNKIINSYNGKRRRIKKRISKMNKNNIWFGTYTIEDKYMNKNHTRKLKEILKGKNFIINSDYGDKNKRLHYHAIIESEEEPTTWSYGFCKFIKVKNNNKEALSKYLTKLTNHTIKKTTDKIIYSRI